MPCLTPPFPPLLWWQQVLWTSLAVPVFPLRHMKHFTGPSLWARSLNLSKIEGVVLGMVIIHSFLRADIHSYVGPVKRKDKGLCTVARDDYLRRQAIQDVMFL